MPEREKKEAQKTLKEKIKELSTLHEIGKSINSTLDLDKALKLITQKAARLRYSC